MTIIIDPSAPPPATPPPVTGLAAGNDDPIRETNEAGFAADVIEASMKTPVIVDFWAPWCGPCKTLGPLLEKLVRELKGAVRMVKINIDENRQLATQLRIQSIPTVYAFFQGQPVDAFQGALPESELRDFLKRLTGGRGLPVEDTLDQAEQALKAGDGDTAGALFRQVLEHNSANARAIAGILRVAIADGALDDARAFAAALDDATAGSPEVAAAISALELSEQARTGSKADSGALEAAIEARPGDLQTRFDLALALIGRGDNAAAVDHLIELVRRDRSWNDSAAREQLLKIFEAVGFADPIAVEGRKKLSTVLFS